MGLVEKVEEFLQVYVARKGGEYRDLERQQEEDVAVRGFRTPSGYLTKARVSLKTSTVVLLTSEEGLHSSTQEDTRRLISFMSVLNEEIDFGSVIFNFETQEVMYKTGQVIPDENSVSDVLTFMLKMHEDKFKTIATAVQTLFSNLSFDPVSLARDVTNRK